MIKVAHYFAGLTLGEADVLRRGMSGKYRSRSEFEQAKEAFFTKAVAKGHPKEMVEEVWRQTESFAGYAFAKGHSASYAVESYQSLFLKAHYPLEYLVATLNNSGGFYRPEFYVHEARMQGGVIEAPCVNQSAAGATVCEKNDLPRIGLREGLGLQDRRVDMPGEGGRRLVRVADRLHRARACGNRAGYHLGQGRRLSLYGEEQEGAHVGSPPDHSQEDQEANR